MATYKPCPFDGEEPSLLETNERYFSELHGEYRTYCVGYSIRCETCGIEMHEEIESELEKRWNTRAGDPKPVDDEGEV